MRIFDGIIRGHAVRKILGAHGNHYLDRCCRNVRNRCTLKHKNKTETFIIVGCHIIYYGVYRIMNISTFLCIINNDYFTLN